MNESELQQAFARIRGGDREAFTQVYRDLSKPVYTIALRIVRHREGAEDVTQEVFLWLFASPPDASVKHLRAWIFRMARNLAIDAMRTQPVTESDEALSELADPVGSETEQIDVRIDVEAAVARLPRVEREIVTLHLSGGLGFAEIGRIVGLSLPATYRRYRQALGTLRDQLGG